MTNLKSLTFTALPQINSDPKLIRRDRLVQRIEEQRQLAKDPSFVPVSKRWKKNDDGSKVLIDHQRRLKPWWRTDANENVVLAVRSGLKTLEFEKGKTGISVGSVEALDKVFVTLIAAVRAGELDGLLDAVKAVGDGRGIPKSKRVA